MTLYDTVKVFDLSSAPSELRESEDLALLRPGSAEAEPAILTLTVGEYHTRKDGPVNDCITREITLTEYQLHRWLAEHGAEVGENVLLRWKNGTGA